MESSENKLGQVAGWYSMMRLHPQRHTKEGPWRKKFQGIRRARKWKAWAEQEMVAG